MDIDAPGRLLAWLRDVARSTISQPRFVRAVDALVAELLVSDVVGGRRAKRIIDEARARRPQLDQIAASPPDEEENDDR
jgi:hypothetical protein